MSNRGGKKREHDLGKREIKSDCVPEIFERGKDHEIARLGGWEGGA